ESSVDFLESLGVPACPHCGRAGEDDGLLQRMRRFGWFDDLDVRKPPLHVVLMMQAGYLTFDVYPVYFDLIAGLDYRVWRIAASQVLNRPNRVARIFFLEQLNFALDRAVYICIMEKTKPRKPEERLAFAAKWSRSRNDSNRLHQPFFRV